MGRPKMSDEEKAKAARSRARLRAMGKLPPLGTQKRGKRLTKGPKGARVKPGRKPGRPAGSVRKAPQDTGAVREPRVQDNGQGLLAVSMSVHNLQVKFDQTIGQLQGAIINANSHIVKLYELVGQKVGAPLLPAAVDAPVAPQANGHANGVVAEGAKKKGRPALSEEEKAARAAAKEKVNATPVVAEVQKPVAVADDGIEEVETKPVVAVATKVISVPESAAYTAGSTEDLGLD